ncbi:MAG: glycosyltransferase [Prevotellaceae bacterium]|jgi:glycosyltransferase involved in cell wall biosynthesis|nr:glycosyltransferase [Prevotellaceae bacterium]
MFRYSIIIPVYNRPEEIDELLNSLKFQTWKDFELTVVEDGSTLSCKSVVDKYAASLNLKYFYKENSGPGPSRNFGAGKSQGDYLIFFDSDCVIPEKYFEEVEKELSLSPLTGVFGGADKASPSFTNIQKAINYGMTSFLTTGGIRGGAKRLDKFYPRTFNLGVKKDVFDDVGGFSAMRYGEDVDFSIRVINAGYDCKLFPRAWVYHKRRTDFRKFFKQVYHSGAARIDLYKLYPKSLKPVHVLPSIFTLGSVMLLILSFFSIYFLIPLVFFTLLLFVDSLARNKNVHVALLSVIACYIQLYAYGWGFIKSFTEKIIFRKGT